MPIGRTGPITIGIPYLDGEMPLLGDPPLIGFRTETSGQFQYGWIELGIRGPHYQPIRWAYQTELNTPITVIPEPASLTSVLLCLVLAGSRVPCRQWHSMSRRLLRTPC